MTTDEMVAGLREYASAVAGADEIAGVPVEELADNHMQIRARYIDANGWIETHASAIADELERLRAEVERLSTPDIWWDKDAPEEPCYSPEDYYVFGDLKDGDCITFMAARRLPNEVYKLVDNPKVDGDYDVVLVPDAKGGG